MVAVTGTLFLTDTRRKLTTWTVLECYSPGHLWVVFSLCACTSFCWCRVNAWRVQNTHSLIRNTGMTVVMSQPSLSDYYHQPLLLLLLLTLPQASVGFQPCFFSVITLFFFQSLPLFIMMLKLTNGYILKWLAEFSYFSTTHLLEGGKIVRRNFVKDLYSEFEIWIYVFFYLESTELSGPQHGLATGYLEDVVLIKLISEMEELFACWVCNNSLFFGRTGSQ